MRIVFDRIGQQVDEDLLYPRAVGVDEVVFMKLRKGHADAAQFCLWFYHGLAFAYGFDDRHRLHRQRQLARLDYRKVKDFIDQFQQMPSCLQNLIDAALLRVRGRRHSRIHQLGESEDGAKRRAQLMAHAGEKFRFRKIGFISNGSGPFKLGIIVLQQLIQTFALSDVAKHQHRADNKPITVTNRCTTVGDIALAAVACNHNGMVSQA